MQFGIQHYESIVYSAIVRSFEDLREFEEQFPPEHPAGYDRDCGVGQLSAAVITKAKGAASTLYSGLLNAQAEPTGATEKRLGELVIMLTDFVIKTAKKVRGDASDWAETSLQPLKKHAYVVTALASLKADAEEAKAAAIIAALPQEDDLPDLSGV